MVKQFGGTYESAVTDERKEFNEMLKHAKNSKVKINFYKWKTRIKGNKFYFSTFKFLFLIEYTLVTAIKLIFIEFFSLLIFQYNGF